ncbi:hypothetical protein [Nocardia sp. AG03]|uniref:hypothetical protein n=1 Tax=Nocardia sp. AG03 TaxID=3025312 RepID=UPI002418B869|nr:hypothetical protein [Nocardia sp. AG03]
MDAWYGTVQRILYTIQFDAELNQAVVDRVADRLVTHPFDYVTAEDEYTALTDGLRHQAPMPSLISILRQSPAEVRDFLTRVVAEMDAMRPWPVLPFTPLRPDRLPEFRDSRPLARIGLPVNDIEGRFARVFHRDNDEGEFLLLRLRSGATIGFFASIWNDSYDVLLTCASPEHDPRAVLHELTDTGCLHPDHLFDLDEDALHPDATRYATTPLRPEFHGEHLPGNAIWPGSQVEYLDHDTRQTFRLHGYNGLLHDHRGAPFDTTEAHTLWTPTGGRAIFVMDHNGTLYSAPSHTLGRFHPSSLLAGAPVAAAGEIAASAGRVLLISDHGRHYRPRRTYTRQVLDSLRRQSLPTADIQLEFHWPE